MIYYVIEKGNEWEVFENTPTSDKMMRWPRESLFSLLENLKKNGDDVMIKFQDGSLEYHLFYS